MRFLALVLESEEPSESSLTSRVAKLPLKEFHMLQIMEEPELTTPEEELVTRTMKTLMKILHSMDGLNTVKLYP